MVCGVRYSMPTIFQSTLSVRRATQMDTGGLAAQLISIHALRKESDRFRQGAYRCIVYFNPRSP